ncbi:MAG: hypothetical protein GY750_13380 [Lentisphaerae bacterium]|nr:hypothetical protein [Lentisphaerota bacterium]
MERLLTADEVARSIGVPRTILATWRYNTLGNRRSVERGPKFIYLIKNGKSLRHLRYRESDVDKWVKSLRAI